MQPRERNRRGEGECSQQRSCMCDGRENLRQGDDGRPPEDVSHCRPDTWKELLVVMRKGSCVGDVRGISHPEGASLVEGAQEG